MKSDICIFVIISAWMLLRMTSGSDKTRRENQNTHFVFNNSSENSAFYEIMWINIVQQGRPQKAIWRMRVACWIAKVINSHIQYVMVLLSHYTNGCTNVPERYVIRTVQYGTVQYSTVH